MSERDGFQAGVPCWVETWQADADAAADFYSAVFGWECEGEPGGPYMCRLRGRDVAMVGQLPPEHAHRPAAWMTNVQVDDAEETAARVREAGGSVPLGPFDAMDGGMIAVVADPAGAHLSLWELGGHKGAHVVNEPGAWSWTQLHTSDPEGAKRFYARVFGWETEMFGEGDDAATMFKVPGYHGGEPEQPVPRDVVAGMAPPAEAGDFPHWLIDFWVDDVDATVATATERGGRAVAGPEDGGFFRQAVIADPAGAAFSITKITIGE